MAHGGCKGDGQRRANVDLNSLDHEYFKPFNFSLAERGRMYGYP